MRRLVDRNGLAKEEAIRRIRAQMSLREKLKYADYAINTDGSLEDIREQVRKIHGDLMALGQRYGGTSSYSPAPMRNEK